MPTFKKKYAAAVVVIAGAIVASSAGAAYAYWSSTGTGTGGATTGSASASGIAITDSSAHLTAMYPGDSAQTVTVTATNSSSTQKAYVTGISAYLTVTKATGAASGTCDPSDYLLDGTAGVDQAHPAALTWTAQELAASHSATTTFTLQFNNKTSAQDGCQGAAVAIAYTSN